WKRYKLELAENYTRLALEVEIESAPFLLAHILYEQNKNKHEVSDLLVRSKPHTLGGFDAAILPVIETWLGNFEFSKKQLYNLIKQENPFLIKAFEGLLIHHQTLFILYLFEAPEFGEKLKEEFLPVYYAAQLLMSNANTFSIKIPPEL